MPDAIEQVLAADDAVVANPSSALSRLKTQLRKERQRPNQSHQHQGDGRRCKDRPANQRRQNPVSSVHPVSSDPSVQGPLASDAAGAAGAAKSAATAISAGAAARAAQLRGPGASTGPANSSNDPEDPPAIKWLAAVGLPFIGRGLHEVCAFKFDPDTQMGVGLDPGVTKAVSAASGVWDPVTGFMARDATRHLDIVRWSLTKQQLKHDMSHRKGGNHRGRGGWQGGPHRPAAASARGAPSSAHVVATMKTFDSATGPKWACQRVQVQGAEEVVLERFFNKLVEEAAEVSRRRWGGLVKQLVVFYGSCSCSYSGVWDSEVILRACRKVVEGRGGRVVLVHEFRTSRVSSALHGHQPCELQLDPSQPRPPDWFPPEGQVQHRLLRPAWSQRRGKKVRGLLWCPLVPPHVPPAPPAAAQPAAGLPGSLSPPPTPRVGPGDQGKASRQQEGRWINRDVNSALNLQRIGESVQRPLELCWWPGQGHLPREGEEYLGLGYKKVKDRLPKEQQRVQRQWQQWREQRQRWRKEWLQWQQQQQQQWQQWEQLPQWQQQQQWQQWQEWQQQQQQWQQQPQQPQQWQQQQQWEEWWAEGREGGPGEADDDIDYPSW